MSMAAIPSSAPLIRGLDRGDEEYLGQALRHLSSESDSGVFLATLKSLVRHGMAGLALMLLERLSSHADDVRELHRTIASLPSGEIPSSQLQAHWIGARLRVSQRLHGTLIDDLPPRSPSWRVFESRAGNLQVVQVNPDGKLTFPLYLHDHLARARSMSLPPPAECNAFVLSGVPHPATLQRLVDVIRSDHFRPPIDILETDVQVFTNWIALIDHPTLLEPARINIFLGPDCVALHAAHWCESRHRGSRAVFLSTPRSGFNPPRPAAELPSRVASAQRQRMREDSQRLIDRYGSCDSMYWSRRFAQAAAQGPPLRVLGLTSRFSTVLQHSLRDLGHAFVRAGCEFDLVMQPDDYSESVDVAGALLAKPYDIIAVIDHLRFEFSELLPENLPYVGWIQDHMSQLCTAEAGRSIGPFDVIVGHSPEVMHSLYGYPADRFVASSNLTDPSTYSASRVPDADLTRFKCDISYVSHGSASPEQLMESIAGESTLLKRCLTRLLELIREGIHAKGWLTNQDLVALMIQAETESGHPPLTPTLRRNSIYPAAASLYDRVFRHQTIAWTAAWARRHGREFRLYGRGWEKHPEFAEFAQGEVESGYDLRCLYQASSISLQANGYGSLHQRLLDGLAAGAFMLARFNPADFVRDPFLAIQRRIQRDQISSLAEFGMARDSDRDLDRICCDAELLTSAVLRPLTDARRAAHARIMREGNPIPELESDEGLLALLREMRYLPHRAAGDLPGFRSVTFESEAALHHLLDRFIDDVPGRSAVSVPMRASVLEHDTYDTLVRRIIQSFLTSWSDSNLSRREVGISCAGCS